MQLQCQLEHLACRSHSVNLLNEQTRGESNPSSSGLAKGKERKLKARNNILICYLLIIGQIVTFDIWVLIGKTKSSNKQRCNQSRRIKSLPFFFLEHWSNIIAFLSFAINTVLVVLTLDILCYWIQLKIALCMILQNHHASSQYQRLA